GSDAECTAAAASSRDGEAGRTGGSRMLLDDLLATRNQPEPTPAPTPTLSIEPIEVPVAPDPGRRGARQRIHELEDVARRNLRSAEEARHALFEEHERLVQESTARVAVEREASALRPHPD